MKISTSFTSPNTTISYQGAHLGGQRTGSATPCAWAVPFTQKFQALDWSDQMWWSVLKPVMILRVHAARKSFCLPFVTLSRFKCTPIYLWKSASRIATASCLVEGLFQRSWRAVCTAHGLKSYAMRKIGVSLLKSILSGGLVDEISAPREAQCGNNPWTWSRMVVSQAIRPNGCLIND